MKQPGPDHPITVVRHPGLIRVSLNGTVLAETRAALSLEEAGYGPVLYVPRADARFEHFVPSARTSHCPYKGDARYFDLQVAGAERRDAVWSYEEPYPAVSAIRGHLAFYSDKVDPIAVLD